MTPFAALAAFLILSINRQCRDCAAPLALFTAASLLFYMDHHLMFVAFVSIDALIAIYISKHNTTQATVIMCLCLCSMLTNIYGFSLYYIYLDMSDYNLIIQSIIIAQLVSIWILRDGGMVGLHILYDVFCINSANSHK